MARQLKHWLQSYLQYTEGTEAPRLMHFWTGVSAIAGAIRKQAWIDMKRFKWIPNFFIIIVAPPGIISKTTTMDIGMDLLKKVPGITFGPDVITWQALVQVFAQSMTEFLYDGAYHPMSALTIASGELGNLIDPRDPDMMNLYITLYDGKAGLEKVTKSSGSDSVSAPYLNLIGCTTPHWIAENMPVAAIGGGFTSRCIFVYGEAKENCVPYPDESARPDLIPLREALIADLEHISITLIGPFTILEEARAWGREWYEKTWGKGKVAGDNPLLENYLARKQTHMHKLAMIISAAQRDDRTITLEDLRLAEMMLTETEQGFNSVFARIGRTEQSLHAERLLAFIRRHGKVKYAVAYRYVYNEFPSFSDFGSVLAGLMKSQQVRFELSGDDPTDGWLVYTGELSK